jgi:hypothetical protein
VLWQHVFQAVVCIKMHGTTTKIISNRLCRESQSTHFSFLNPAVYEILWKDNVDPGRPQMTIRRMRIAYLRLQTHTQYVILISFPLQQLLHERASF